MLTSKAAPAFKHVLCVYPYRSDLRGVGFVPPLGLEYIAAVIEPFALSLDLVDLRYEPGHTRDFLRPETELVCFSVNWDCDAAFMRDEICSVPPGILTVLGGRHASEDPERWLTLCPNVAVVVRGDGEEIVEELCRGVPLESIAGISFRRDGRIIHNAARKLGPVRNDITPLRRLRRQPYPVLLGGLNFGLEVELASGSRGCPFNCTFCSFSRNPWGEKRAWSGRSPESVVEELAAISAPVVMFVDDLFTCDMNRVERICDLILQRGIRKKYVVNARLEIARHPEVLRKMVRAGFVGLLVGIESAQDKTLRACAGRRALDFLRRPGIMAAGSASSRTFRQAGDMAEKTPQPEAPAPAHGKPSALLDTRVIYCGDNLEQLRKLPAGCVDLIYIDPPFNSNRNYEAFWGETREKRAFEDRHASTEAYIQFMQPRCVELHRVPKPTGSFYYHCDWHASHYVKVMVDRIFGENQFQNEIIWKRTTSHGDSQTWSRVHDTILFYTASDTFTWNPQHAPHGEEYLATKYKYQDADGRRYMLDNMTSPNPRPNMMYEWKGHSSPEKGWRYSKETMAKLDVEGRIWYPDDKSKRPRLKRYLDEMPGMPITTIWTDIWPINSQAAERLGYPTQKPLALMERVIKSSTSPNDIVLDAFCGCGTALVAAETLGRQWIGIDISPTACRVMAKRMRDVCKLKEDENLWRIGRGFVVRDLPWTEEQLPKIPPFEFENWAVIALGGISNKAQVGDAGIDGRIYPVSAMPEKADKSQLAFMDDWYPIQVKQREKISRPDVDAFETAMQRANRKIGFMVAFDYSSDALAEIDGFFRRTGLIIRALAVKDILEERLAQKLA
jgi:site-specific DNA-methyltransferase (adenine-specific)